MEVKIKTGTDIGQGKEEVILIGEGTPVTELAVDSNRCATQQPLRLHQAPQSLCGAFLRVCCSSRGSRAINLMGMSFDGLWLPKLTHSWLVIICHLICMHTTNAGWGQRLLPSSSCRARPHSPPVPAVPAVSAVPALGRACIPVACAGSALQTCSSEDSPYLTSRCLLDTVTESSLTLLPVCHLSGDLFSGLECYSYVDKVLNLPCFFFTHDCVQHFVHGKGNGNPKEDRQISISVPFPFIMKGRGHCS